MKDKPIAKSDQPSGKLIDMLIERIDEIASVQTYENADETEVTIRMRTAEQLKRAGISMRNIDGEWIKE